MNTNDQLVLGQDGNVRPDAIEVPAARTPTDDTGRARDTEDLPGLAVLG